MRNVAIRRNPKFTCFTSTETQILPLMRLRAYKTLPILFENTVQCPVVFDTMSSFSPFFLLREREREDSERARGERERKRKRERESEECIVCACLCMRIMNACVLYLYAR